MYEFTASAAARFATNKKDFLSFSVKLVGMRRSSTARSPAATSARASAKRPAEESGAEDSECPICFESLTEANRTRPFSCVHVLCAKCDLEMYSRAQDRCPICREQRSEVSRMNLASADLMHRRVRALAEEQAQRVAVGVLFFPVEPAVDLGPPRLQPQELQHSPPVNAALPAQELQPASPALGSERSESPRAPHEVSLVDTVDDGTREAVSALLRMVPLGEFRRIASAIRWPHSHRPPSHRPPSHRPPSRRPVSHPSARSRRAGS